MSVPANVLQGLFQNIGAMSRGVPALPPELQAAIMARLQGMAPPPPVAVPPPAPVAPAPTAPTDIVPAAAVPVPAPAPAPAPAAPPQVMAAQEPPSNGPPLGAVLNPAAAAPVDPFAGNDPATQGPPEPDAQQKPRRLQAWRDFIQKYKTDPNVRISVMQSLLALTQPAGSAAESIGNALNTGLRTMEGLRMQSREMARQDAEDQREERQVAVQEGGLQQRREQAIAENEIRLKQLEQDAAYQQEMLKLRRAEVGQRGEQGQVNQRWQQLTDALLAQPDQDLLRFPEGEERRNRARLRAFDMISSAGQTRQKFIADFIASQQLIELPEPTEAGYRDALANLVQKATSFADAAGLFDERAAPPGATQAPAATPLPPGITEGHVQEAMQVLGLTRDQVLQRYMNATQR